jgi:hypothetical protein
VPLFRQLIIWLGIVIVMVVAIPFLSVKFDWGVAASEAEMQANRLALGEQRNAEAIDKTLERFDRYFVKPGLYQAYVYSGSADSILQAPKLRSSWRLYAEAMWQGILRAMYRAEINWPWYTTMFFVAVASVIDGAVVRASRAAQLYYSNPTVFYVVTHAALAKTVAILVIALFIPFHVPALLWLAVTSVVGLLLYLASSNFQTGG